MTGVEIGPEAVARIATGTCTALSELADPLLAARAEAVRHGHPSSAAYEVAYRDALAEGRRRLESLTVEDERFRLALAFANPQLAERLADFGGRRMGPSRRRRLDATLYRYLARWATRCEPFGLWTAVARVTWGRETRIGQAVPLIRVTPDLQPFYRLVADLSARPEYRESARWRLNPTLGLQADGAWVFSAPTPVGAVPRRLRVASGVIERLERCGTADLATFARELAASEAGKSVAETLRLCVEGGILVGGLQPAWCFRTPWEAFEATESELLPADRVPWNRGWRRLEQVCGELESRRASLAADDVLAGHRVVARLLEALATELGLPCPEMPEALLRCDQGSSLEIQLGEEVRVRIERTLDDYLAFQGCFGFGAALRRAVLRHYLPPGATACRLDALPLGTCSSGGATTWEEVAQAVGGDGDFARRLERWRSLLRQGDDRVVAQGQGRLPSPPFGWIRLGFTSPPAGSGEIVVHGVFDDLWGPYARFTSLWNDGSAPDPLRQWFARRLEAIERESGLDLAELVAPFAPAPNVLARPSLAMPPVGPWTCLPGSIELRGGTVEVDPRRGAVLRSPVTERPIAVLNTASADVQSRDPLVQLLCVTSGSGTPAASMQAASLLFAHELDGGRTSPSVVLASGAIVRTRRTVLAREVVRSLQEDSESGRFAAWVKLARSRGLPELLLARRGDGMTLMVHRDSPLAVASLFHGGQPTSLTLEHWPGQAWVDDGTRSLVGELAVPFLRGEHVWSGGAGGDEGAKE